MTTCGNRLLSILLLLAVLSPWLRGAHAFGAGLVIYKNNSFDPDSQAEIANYRSIKHFFFVDNVLTSNGESLRLTPDQEPIYIPMVGDPGETPENVTRIITAAERHYPQFYSKLETVRREWGIPNATAPAPGPVRTGSAGPVQVLRTLSGGVYESWKISSVDGEIVTISHAAGISRVPITDFPDEVIEKSTLLKQARIAAKAKLKAAGTPGPTPTVVQAAQGGGSEPDKKQNVELGGTGVADFQVGDLVQLTKDTQLSFRNNPIRTGKAGEMFPVLAVQAGSQKVFLLSKDADGGAIAVSVVEDSVKRAFGAKLSAREAEFLSAASDDYVLDGKPVFPPANRGEVMAANAESSNAVAKKIAGEMAAMDVLDEAAKKAPKERARVLDAVTRQWRGVIGGDILSAATGEDKSNREVVSEAEEVMLPIQKQQTQELELEIHSADIPNAMREDVSALAAGKNIAPANGAAPVAISTLVDRPGLWVQVENRGAYTLNHCVITGRRIQDQDRVNEMNKDRLTADALMAMVGASGTATAVNDFNSQLAIRTYGMETGGFVYVPVLRAGSFVRFPVSSFKGLNFTKRVEASLWCDEGAAVAIPAGDLAAVLKAYQDALEEAARKQRAQAQGNSRGALGGSSNQPWPTAPNGRRANNLGVLQPSTGLQPSGGL